MSCLIALVAGCGETPAGDFCDVARPDVYASDEVVEYMVENDPDHVRLDLAENEYGEENCGWDQ